MHRIVRNHGFNCLFMYVSSPKYWIFRHWLSEVNTLEMKNFHIHLGLVLIRKIFISKANILTKTSKYWQLILAGCKYICGPAKFHLQLCQIYVWLSKWVIISVNYDFVIEICEFLSVYSKSLKESSDLMYVFSAAMEESEMLMNIFQKPRWPWNKNIHDTGQKHDTELGCIIYPACLTSEDKMMTMVKQIWPWFKDKT